MVRTCKTTIPEKTNTKDPTEYKYKAVCVTEYLDDSRNGRATLISNGQMGNPRKKLEHRSHGHKTLGGSRPC